MNMKEIVVQVLTLIITIIAVFQSVKYLFDIYLKEIKDEIKTLKDRVGLLEKEVSELRILVLKLLARGDDDNGA
jgi:hypothetical protein